MNFPETKISSENATEEPEKHIAPANEISKEFTTSARKRENDGESDDFISADDAKSDGKGEAADEGTKQTKRRKKRPCKCGSHSHFRVTSSLCPLNNRSTPYSDNISKQAPESSREHESSLNATNSITNAVQPMLWMISPGNGQVTYPIFSLGYPNPLTLNSSDLSLFQGLVIPAAYINQNTGGQITTQPTAYSSIASPNNRGGPPEAKGNIQFKRK